MEVEGPLKGSLNEFEPINELMDETCHLALLPTDILGVISDYLMDKETFALYQAAGRDFRRTLTQYGGIKSVNFRPGKPIVVCLPTSGTSFYHVNRPLVNYTCTYKSVPAFVVEFRQLTALRVRVTSSVSFFDFNPKILKLLPPTLLELDLSFPASLAVLWQDPVLYDTRVSIAPYHYFANKDQIKDLWLPLSTLFPRLRTLMINSMSGWSWYGDRSKFHRILSMLILHLPSTLISLGSDIFHDLYPLLGSLPSSVQSLQLTYQSDIGSLQPSQFSCLPVNLHTLELHVISTPPAVLSILPSSILHLNVYALTTLEHFKALPRTLKSLVVQTILSLTSEKVFALPRSLTYLHSPVDKQKADILGTPNALPSGLTLLRNPIPWGWNIPTDITHLPKSLTCLSMVMHLIPPSAFETQFSSLSRTLVQLDLEGATVKDSDILDLPNTVTRLTLGVIQLTGLFLQEGIFIIEQKSVIASAVDYLTRFFMPIVPSLQVNNLVRLPSTITDMKWDVRIKQIPIDQLPKGIKSLINYDLLPEQLPLLPPGVTRLSHCTNLNHEQMELVPSHVKEISGPFVLKHSDLEYFSSTNPETLTYPEEIFNAFKSRHSDRIKFNWSTMNAMEMTSAIKKIEIDSLKTLILKENTFDGLHILPKNLTKLVVSNNLSHMPYHGLEILPKSLLSLEIAGIMTNDLLKRQLPPNLTFLRMYWVSFDLIINVLYHLPKSLTELDITGNLDMTQEYLSELPPKLVKLRLDSNDITSSALPLLPDTLAEIKFGKKNTWPGASAMIQLKRRIEKESLSSQSLAKKLNDLEIETPTI